MRRTLARIIGMDLREYLPLDTEQDGDNIAADSPAPALNPTPCSSFSLKRDVDFVDKWEDFVRNDDRCNNSVCSFLRNYAIFPLFVLFEGAVFLTPLWGLLLNFRPLLYLLWVLGVITCALYVLACSLAVLGSLSTLRLPRPGGVAPNALALLREIANVIAWALRCFCATLFVQNVLFGVIMIGDFALVAVSGLVLVKMVTCCGVVKGGKVPVVQITVEPQPRSWFEKMTRLSRGGVCVNCQGHVCV